MTALQTLFLRNHNRLAGQLQTAHPAWTDEQVYQEARKLNIAEYQKIVFNGWIPAVLGKNALAAYKGYNPNVNATISNEFSTVAFRFGHSLLSASIDRQTNAGTEISDVSPSGAAITLAQDFFDPYLLNPTGAVDPLTGHTSSDIGPILKSEADGVSQATDLMAVGDVRNLLFGNGGFGGEDLMARDVQRDRDNGIPDYNSLRAALGLPRVTSFAQISSNVKVQQELALAYPGGVNTIDAFEGGLAEDHVPGSDVGPLFQAILVNQFARLRDGDRFFYLNQNFNVEERGLLGQGDTLAKVIEANTNVTNLQSDVFVFKASVSGWVDATAWPSHHDPNGWYDRSLGTLNVSGMTLELQDSAGDVLATTVTDAQGRYTFTQLSGPSADTTLGSGLSTVGTYKVVLMMPSEYHYPSDPSATIVVTNGNTQMQEVNFQIGWSSEYHGRGGWHHRSHNHD